MTEEQIVRHFIEATRFRIKYEKAAGVRTGDGFTVEAAGNDLNDVSLQAEALYQQAKEVVAPSIIAENKKGE